MLSLEEWETLKRRRGVTVNDYELEMCFSMSRTQTDDGKQDVCKESKLSDSLHTDVILTGTNIQAIRLDKAELDSSTILLSGSDVANAVYKPNETWLRAWTKSRLIQNECTELELKHSMVAWSDKLQIGFDLLSATGIQIVTILANKNIKMSKILSERANECVDWRLLYLVYIDRQIKYDFTLVDKASGCGNGLRSLLLSATISQLELFLDTGTLMNMTDILDEQHILNNHGLAMLVIGRLLVLSEIIKTNDCRLLETTALQIFYAWLHSDLTVPFVSTTNSRYCTLNALKHQLTIQMENPRSSNGSLCSLIRANDDPGTSSVQLRSALSQNIRISKLLGNHIPSMLYLLRRELMPILQLQRMVIHLTNDTTSTNAISGSDMVYNHLIMMLTPDQKKEFSFIPDMNLSHTLQKLYSSDSIISVRDFDYMDLSESESEEDESEEDGLYKDIWHNGIKYGVHNDIVLFNSLNEFNSLLDDPKKYWDSGLYFECEPLEEARYLYTKAQYIFMESLNMSIEKAEVGNSVWDEIFLYANKRVFKRMHNLSNIQQEVDKICAQNLSSNVEMELVCNVDKILASNVMQANVNYESGDNGNAQNGIVPQVPHESPQKTLNVDRAKMVKIDLEGKVSKCEADVGINFVGEVNQCEGDVGTNLGLVNDADFESNFLNILRTVNQTDNDLEDGYGYPPEKTQSICEVEILSQGVNETNAYSDLLPEV